MSHLSTIIYRVKSGAEHENFSADPLFEQAVINLMEYIKSWTDHTQEEREEAIKLFDQYRDNLEGKGMPSHKDRLDKADEIRGSL